MNPFQRLSRRMGTLITPRQVRLSPVLLRAVAAIMGALLLMAALVSLATGAVADWNATDVQFQNADFSPSQVFVQFYDLAGVIRLGGGNILSPQQTLVYVPPFQISGTITMTSPGHVLGVVSHGDLVGYAAWPLIDEAQLDKVAYVPRFDTLTSGSAYRLRVNNPNALSTSISVAFYDSLGVTSTTYITTLAPHAATILDADTMKLPLSLHDSAVVRSTRLVYVGVNQVSAATLSAAHAPAQGAQLIVAPMFLNNSDNSWSQFTVQNVGTLTAQVMMTYYHGLTGASIATTTALLKPYAAFTWANPVAPSVFGQVIATSPQPLAGYVSTARPTAPKGEAAYTAIALQPALPDDLDRHVLYGPLVQTADNDWSSDLFIANPNSAAAQVRLVFSAAPTGTTYSITPTIPPHQVLKYPTTGLDPVFRRSAVRAWSNQMIAGVVRSTRSQTDSLAAYEMLYAPPIVDLEKTVGVTPGACASTNTLSVPYGAAVTYCYRLINTSGAVLPQHTLQDDQLGVLLSNLMYTLTSGSQYVLTRTVVLTQTVTNTALWQTSADTNPSAIVAQAQAQVNVAAPAAITTWPLSLLSDQPRTVAYTQTLTISNTGGSNLNWSISERAGSSCASPIGLPWADVSPASGVVPPSSQTIVRVILTAAELNLGGTYTGALCLTSNDPAHPQMIIPLTLTVWPAEIYLPLLLRG